MSMPSPSHKARALNLCQFQKQDLEEQIAALHAQLNLLEETMRRLADMPSDVAERLAGVLAEVADVPEAGKVIALRGTP